MARNHSSLKPHNAPCAKRGCRDSSSLNVCTIDSIALMLEESTTTVGCERSSRARQKRVDYRVNKEAPHGEREEVCEVLTNGSAVLGNVLAEDGAIFRSDDVAVGVSAEMHTATVDAPERGNPSRQSMPIS